MAKRISDDQRIEHYFQTCKTDDALRQLDRIKLILRVREINTPDQPKKRERKNKQPSNQPSTSFPTAIEDAPKQQAGPSDVLHIGTMIVGNEPTTESAGNVAPDWVTGSKKKKPAAEPPAGAE